MQFPTIRFSSSGKVMVTTADLVSYVQALEPSCEPDVTHHEDDMFEIKLDYNGLGVRHEFTED